jgi:hypothetical protein
VVGASLSGGAFWGRWVGCGAERVGRTVRCVGGWVNWVTGKQEARRSPTGSTLHWGCRGGRGREWIGTWASAKEEGGVGGGSIQGRRWSRWGSLKMRWDFLFGEVWFRWSVFTGRVGS